jgi:hypothetical protein
MARRRQLRGIPLIEPLDLIPTYNRLVVGEALYVKGPDHQPWLRRMSHRAVRRGRDYLYVPVTHNEHGMPLPRDQVGALIVKITAAKAYPRLI